MKKLYLLMLLIASVVFAADVKPFYFENVPDSAQQTSWETLMQYKTFGAYELTFGNELIRITDKSGWIGTSKGNFELGQNGKDTLGGPIVIGGNLTFHNGPDVISTGPLVVAGDVIVTEEGFKDRGNVFAGYQCVKGNVDPRYAKFVPEEYRFFGEDYDKCPLDSTYINDTSLTVPILKNDTAVYVSLKDLDSTFSGGVIDNKTVTINVPVGSYKEPYDIYIDKIAFSNAGKLVVKQQQGGRLTRIFLRDGITFSSFTKIVVAYCDSVGNCAELDNTDYSGTLLFYSMEDISFPSFDKSTSLQGSFISHGKISIAHHLILAGQILANNLSINTDFDGSTFLYVPFDPPVLNFDPTALASGKFVENDIPTKIDVHLDTLAKTDVLFDYCFIVKDTTGYASKADFNDEIPICEESVGTAVIKKGTKTLVDDIFLNVKLDGLVEDDEKLVLKVYNLQGAVLPGNVHSGFFYLTLTDGVKVNTAPELDKNQKIDPYEEEQLIPPCTGEIGKITVKDEKPNDLKFELTDPSGLFVIDNTGKITTSHVFDYETEDTVYVVQVKVTDHEGLSDSANYEIKIKNKDEDIVATADIKPVYEGPADSIIGGIVGTVTGKDGDSTKVSYKLTDPTGSFVINPSTGVITIAKELDYEKTNKYPVTVSMTSTDGSKKDTSFVISVLNVNEPVHVKDTTFTIDENKKGVIGKVEAWDEDNDKISYRVSDSTKYSIDDNGVISVKVPFDFETQKNDSLIVYVKDPSGMTDSAVIHINVKDEPESSNVQIVHVDTRDSVYTETDKPIYTNDKDIEITYKTDDKHKDTTITGLKEGENKIEICDVGVGKDTKGCDTVTVWYSNKTPVITVATIDKNKSNVNNITIIDEPDGNQYVNNKNPEIKVTVKDPTNAKKDTTFNINVDLKTVDVPVKSLTNKTIEPIIGDIVPMGMENYKYETVGKDSVRISYYDPIVKATISYIVNEKEERINDEFTVSWVEKVNGQDVTISYTTDSYVEVKSNYSISYSVPQGKDTITVSYQVDSDGKIQKTNGNVGYTISYSYTNAYGNTGTSEIQVVLDDVPPKVEIYKLIAGKDTIYPGEGKNWTEYVASSSITVFWTVDGKDQDTLTLQGLKAEKINPIVRCYQDKANNQTCDTVNVYAKGAKEIEIKIAHPVTEIDKDRVDSFYNEGGKYNPKNPIQIIAQDASEDKLPEPVGVGIKIGLALPILNQNGGMPTADDIVQTIDGVTGIVIDGNGNVVTDAIAEIRDNSTKIISVDNYIENYCTDQYKEEVRKNGIEKVPFYDMKYSMHVWIFNNNANYVNDFNFEYTIDENQKVDASGMLNLMVDWLAAKDGYVKAANGKAIATGAYLTKLEAKSISTAKCTLNADTKKGTKIKKTEYDLTSFGYKRPIHKR